MYHTILFAAEYKANLETSPKSLLERWTIRRGTRLRAQLRPSVVETSDGPVEVADLYFDDGTAARSVPFATFTFEE